MIFPLFKHLAAIGLAAIFSLQTTAAHTKAGGRTYRGGGSRRCRTGARVVETDLSEWAWVFTGMDYVNRLFRILGYVPYRRFTLGALPCEDALCACRVGTIRS